MGFLTRQPSSKAHCLIQTPGRDESRYASWTNVQGNFSSLKLGFQKILPNLRNPGGRNKILIISDDLETTVKSHDIPLRGVYHLMRDLQDTLLSHSL